MLSPYAKVLTNPKVGPYGKRTYRYRYPQQYRERIPKNISSYSESKYFDVEVDDFDVPANTAWAATNDIFKGTMAIPVEGSDIDNRIGRKISVYKICVRGMMNHSIEQDQADALIPPMYRLIFWMDKQTNATVTTSASLMTQPTAAESDTCFNTFQNLANLGRFRVMKDIVLEPSQTNLMQDSLAVATSSQSLQPIPFKLVVKFKKPIVVRFNSTNGGTIADVVDNSFYLSAQKQFASFSTTATCRSRVYYKDV